jgi:hypothetical protein
MRVFDIGAKDGPQAVSNRVLTIPNLLSFARLAALPVIYLDLVTGRYVRAFVLLAVFASLGFSYEELSEGALLTAIPLNPMQTGQPHLLVIAEIHGGETYTLRVQVPGEQARARRRARFIDLANEWNASHRWPVAFVEQRAANPKESELVLRHSVFLPHGATVEQLAAVTLEVVHASVDFWTWAHTERDV